MTQVRGNPLDIGVPGTPILRGQAATAVAGRRRH